MSFTEIMKTVAPSIVGGIFQTLNTNSANSSTNRATQAFINQSTQYIEATNTRVQEMLAQGREDAAAALVQGTMESVSEIWRGAGLAEETIRSFLGEAQGYLAPTIAQGRYAQDEIARMLGIRNSAGVLEPWDPSLITETPGFKFRDEWGRRAVENSAIQNFLSGETARELTEFGQGLAGTYFDTRVDQLQGLAGLGANAEVAGADMTARAGQQIGTIQANAGQAAGQAYQSQGAGLADIISQFTLGGAQLATSAASTIANLGLAGLTARNNATTARANTLNTVIGDVTQAVTGLPALMGNKTGTATTTPSSNAGSIMGLSSPNAPIYDDFDVGQG